MYVGDNLCYTIPDDSALLGTWITFECAEGADTGTTMTLKQPRDTAIVFCGIEVQGESTA